MLLPLPENLNPRQLTQRHDVAMRKFVPKTEVTFLRSSVSAVK